jgi:hypothetical protein
MGVHEAAYVALAGILMTSFFGAGSTGDNLTARGMAGRREVAARIRGYWKKHRGIPLEERWCRMRADENAAPRQWLQAAANITRPTNVTVVPGQTMFGKPASQLLPRGVAPQRRKSRRSLRQRSPPA